MGAHSHAATIPLPTGGRAIAATGLTALGLFAGTGAALAGDAPSGSTGSSSHDNSRDSECSVGGTPAGGTGTGSPDGVITNGHCSPDEIEQAKRDADTDGDPTTRGYSHRAQEDEDAAEGNPNIVGGTSDGISSQSGTAQKLDPAEGSGARSDDNSVLTGVL